MASGDAASKVITGGGSWGDAMLAGATAAESFDAGLSLAEALSKAQRVVANSESYTLHITDEANADLDSFALGIEESSAISGGDTGDVGTEVEAYLDLQFGQGRLTQMYNDKSLREATRKGHSSRPPPPAAELSGGGEGSAAESAMVAADGASAGGSRAGGSGRVLLEQAAEVALRQAVELEEAKTPMLMKVPPTEGAKAGGCAVM